jgi:CRISPR-associated protein Cas1
VLSAINTRMVTPADFIRVGSAVSLKPSGRKAFIRAYEQRMDTLVTHPLFGYRVNYRRVLEIQARLLGRVIGGEAPRYRGFETRLAIRAPGRPVESGARSKWEKEP